MKPDESASRKDEVYQEAQERFELNRPLMMFLRSVPSGYQCHFDNHTFIPLKAYCDAAAWAIEQLAAPLSEQQRNEYICKCGVRVSPHRCSTGEDF